MRDSVVNEQGDGNIGRVEPGPELPRHDVIRFKNAEGEGGWKRGQV
jgi:hypothetical protein